MRLQMQGHTKKDIVIGNDEEMLVYGEQSIIKKKKRDMFWEGDCIFVFFRL